MTTESDAAHGAQVEHFTIARLAGENSDFRRVLWTGAHSQIVLMTIPVGGDIGAEVHEHTDQVLTFISGVGEADLAGHTHPIEGGDQCAVPAGTRHNFRNTGGTSRSRCTRSTARPSMLATRCMPPRPRPRPRRRPVWTSRPSTDPYRSYPSNPSNPSNPSIHPLHDQRKPMSTTYDTTSPAPARFLEQSDTPVPAPGPGELGVRVRAAVLNPLNWTTASAGQDPQRPDWLGREVAGIVTALGEGVDGFAVGEAILGRVAAGHGGFGPNTIVRAIDVVAKPREISFGTAATIPVAGVAAYDGTHQIDLQAGQTVLILGIDGGVGLMAAQIGQVHEFTVLGTGPEASRDLVEATGATLVSDGDDLLTRLRHAAPDGVDLVLDLVGGDTLRIGAQLATDPAGIISAADAPTAAELGGAALERSADALAKITGVIEYGLVTPHLTARYPLDRLDEAIAVVEGGHAGGLIVIDID